MSPPPAHRALPSPCTLLHHLHDSIAHLPTTSTRPPSHHLTRLRLSLQTLTLRLPTSDRASPPARTYLDLLPEHPLENILRHLSDAPRSPDWCMHISASTAECLYLGTSPLSSLFTRLFPDVALTCDRRKPPRTGGSALFRTPGMPLRLRTWDCAAVRVLCAAGGSLTGASGASERGRDPAPHAVAWVDAVIAHCPRLRRLDVHCMAPPLFARLMDAVGAGLDALELDAHSASAAHLCSVAAHCRRLRRFAAVLRAGAPHALWRALGASLQELHFSVLEPHIAVFHASYDASVNDMIACVQTECRGLRRVAANPVCGGSYPAVARLIASYGAQLEYAKANFSYMASELCREIARKCTEAEFELPYLTRMSAIEELNFQVKNLRMSDAAVFSRRDFEVAGSCQLLEEIAVRRLDDTAPEVVGWLLKEPKPALETLALHLRADNAPQVLAVVARCVRTLRKFRVCAPVMRADGLAEVFGSNRGIERFEFSARTMGREEDAVAAAVEVVGVCRKASELRECVLTASWPGSGPPDKRKKERIEAVADACNVLRFRNVHVKIFGFTYL